MFVEPDTYMFYWRAASEPGSHMLCISVLPFLTCPPRRILLACWLAVLHVRYGKQQFSVEKQMRETFSLLDHNVEVRDHYKQAFLHYFPLSSPLRAVSHFSHNISYPFLSVALLNHSYFHPFSAFPIFLWPVTSIKLFSSSWSSCFYSKSFLLSWCSGDSRAAMLLLLQARKSFK